MNNTVELILRANATAMVAGLKRGEAAIDGFTNRGREKLASFGRGMVSPFAAMISGGTALAVGKQIVDFDANLVRFANNGDMTTGKMFQLREEITNLASADGVFRDEILAGNAAIVQRTGNVQLAVETMNDLTDVSLASGASMEDLGGMTANLSQKFGLSAKEMKTAFGALSAQGKSGSFELADFATQGERIFSAAARFNRNGMESVREVGAMVQIAKMGTSSAEQASTAVENIYSNIIEKQGKLEKLGVKVWDNKKIGKYRDAMSIVKDLIVKTGNDQKVLGEIFGAEGVRGITALSKMFADSKNFNGADSFLDAGRGKEIAVIMQDAARYSDTAQASVRRLLAGLTSLADSALTPAISEIADAIDAITSDPEAMYQLKETFKIIGFEIGIAAEALNKYGGFLVGVLATAKLLKAVGWDKTLPNPFGKKGVPTVPGAGGVPHVWVDNMPVGGFSGKSVPPLGVPKGGVPKALPAPKPVPQIGNASAKPVRYPGVQGIPAAKFVEVGAKSGISKFLGGAGKLALKGASAVGGVFTMPSELGMSGIDEQQRMFSVDQMKQLDLKNTRRTDGSHGGLPQQNQKMSGTPQVTLKDMVFNVDYAGRATVVKTGSYDLFMDGGQ